MNDSLIAGSAVTKPSYRQIVVICMIALATGMVAGRYTFQARFAGEQDFQRKLNGTETTDQVIAACRNHLQSHPHDERARFELAKLLQERDPEQALAELRQIPGTSTEYLTAVRLVASISLALNRDEDAIAPLKLLEKNDANDAGIQQALAEVFYRQRDFEGALQHAQRCRKLQPTNVEIGMLIAEANDNLGRPQEMIEPLEAVLSLDPDLPPAHLNLAYAYEAVGRADEALPHVQQYLKRFPDSVVALRTLASVERGRNRYDEALTAAKAALKRAPKNLECAILAAELLLYQRQAAEAYNLLSGFLSDWSKERRLLTPLLRAAAMSGHAEEARDIQRRIQQIETRE